MKNNRTFTARALLLMKLTLTQFVLAVVLTNLALASPSRAQELLDRRLTLQVQEGEMKRALQAIERQTNVRFMYSPRLIQAERRITINVQNERLGTILEQLLKPFSISYELIGRQIILSKNHAAASATSPADAPLSLMVGNPTFIVTGIVRASDENRPLPGVSVRVKDRNIGTVTNADGRYSLNVGSETDVLVFSSVGFATQEIAVGTRRTLDVVLVVDAQSLGEVVVVGYGTQRQREVTGAVASVGTEDINRVAVTGLDQALQGRMAGVQVTQNSGEPGGSVSVRIRGVGSITSGSEPLYVVDGIPLTGGLNAINPNDIERIDVLKDAASAAIYGSWGTNGVVLVTTKRGKAGRVSVNLDAYAGVQSAAKKLDLLNGPEFARLANDNLRNAGLATNPAWDSANQPTYDWQDAVLQQSPIQNYNVSFSGGGERSRTFFSAGFFQ